MSQIILDQYPSLKECEAVVHPWMTRYDEKRQAYLHVCTMAAIHRATGCTFSVNVFVGDDETARNPNATIAKLNDGLEKLNLFAARLSSVFNCAGHRAARRWYARRGRK